MNTDKLAAITQATKKNRFNYLRTFVKSECFSFHNRVYKTDSTAFKLKRDIIGTQCRINTE